MCFLFILANIYFIEHPIERILTAALSVYSQC